MITKSVELIVNDCDECEGGGIGDGGGGGGGNVKIISTIRPVSSQLELIRDCRYRQEFCPARSAGQFSGRGPAHC